MNPHNPEIQVSLFLSGVSEKMPLLWIMAKKESPEAARARRLQALIESGPRPPQNPNEFVEQKMRDKRRAPGRTPGPSKKK
jgi:hypothetical protein